MPAATGTRWVDRERDVPKGWIADADRREAAGVPKQVTFATKPELARVMLERAVAAGVPAGWGTADEVSGGNPSLRAWLETHRMPYVLARCTEALQPPNNPPTPAKLLAQQVPPERWLTINAAHGAKGRRWYAWTRVELATDRAPDGWGCWLLVRRRLRTGELAFYRCAAQRAPLRSPWSRRPGAAGGSRSLPGHQGAVRAGCASGPPLALLVPVDDPAMLAYAFLVVVARTERTQHSPPPGVIALSCNEIAHLLAALVLRPADDWRHRLCWSWWRRRHQARARVSHSQRQAAQQP